VEGVGVIKLSNGGIELARLSHTVTVGQFPMSKSEVGSGEKRDRESGRYSAGKPHTVKW